MVPSPSCPPSPEAGTHSPVGSSVTSSVLLFPFHHHKQTHTHTHPNHLLSIAAFISPVPIPLSLVTSDHISVIEQ